MHDFTIRLATKKDLSSISKFATPIAKSLKFYNREQMARNIYEMSVKALKETIKENKDSIIIAESKDGNVVGLITQFPGFGHVDWLDWILVDRNFRGKKIGRALVKYAIQQARKHGCHKVWCVSHPNNKQVLKFSQKMGFRKVGILKKHSFQQDEILWEKLIK